MKTPRVRIGVGLEMLKIIGFVMGTQGVEIGFGLYMLKNHWFSNDFLKPSARKRTKSLQNQWKKCLWPTQPIFLFVL